MRRPKWISIEKRPVQSVRTPAQMEAAGTG
jgi:hypothetical protein